MFFDRTGQSSQIEHVELRITMGVMEINICGVTMSRDERGPTEDDDVRKRGFALQDHDGSLTAPDPLSREG